jgi:hypothetical protein
MSISTNITLTIHGVPREFPMQIEDDGSMVIFGLNSSRDFNEPLPLRHYTVEPRRRQPRYKRSILSQYI